MIHLKKLIRSNYKFSIQITKQLYSVKYTRILNEKMREYNNNNSK